MGAKISPKKDVFSPEVQAKFNKVTAVAKGFLTRRLMQTDKLKQLRQTVKVRGLCTLYCISISVSISVLTRLTTEFST